MARPTNKLSDVRCKVASEPGRLSDGAGLYLHVKQSGAKSWAFIWKEAGRRREMGLGPYPAVKLARARALATAARETVTQGRDPIAEKRRKDEPSFGEAADRFLASNEGAWRNEKHRAQWHMTLETYAKSMRAKKVSEVGTDDVLAVLTPLWQKRPETASRLRGRIERVLDFARARGWREGQNPALWRGHLKAILPARQKLTRGHHAAMPYRNVPGFLAQLACRDAMGARGLEFLILTTARSGEVLGARWDEFDLEAGIWTIPAGRMKAGRDHRVPLFTRALAIITALSETRVSDFVFPGQKPGRPLSEMALQMLMQRMDAVAFTVHGFRSAFRDWAGDETSFPREVAEQALAHRVGDATEQAYRRGDALERRRKLMEAWGSYCTAAPAGKMVQLSR